MSEINDILKENCRTCMSYFNENNGKCSLMNCLTKMSDLGRVKLMKDVMATCSLTLFSNNEDDEEYSKTFICTSCIVEMEKMLNFLQKCINSEAILKQAQSSVKRDGCGILVDTQEDNSIQRNLKIKVEGFTQERGIHEMSSSPTSSNRNNNEDPKLECQECHKKFPTALSLTFHRYKHADYKPHVCVICHENFRTLQLIKKHMAAEHEKEQNKRYQCRQCLEVFTSKHHLNLHEKKIHSAKKYNCGVCKRTFSAVSSLKFHENIHLSQQLHFCTLCSKTFTSAAVLREHKRNVHSDINQFKCHYGRSFNLKKKFELHVESVHEKKDKSRRYSCSDCNKKFHHPYSLRNHLNTHLGVKPFLCNACGSAFSALSNLTSHLRRIHSGDKQPSVKKYLCHSCGDSFTRGSHLQRHTLRKHVPNAEKKHECPICKKKFLEKSDVTGHIKLHDDVKPFVCDQCSKCFRTAWRLQAHVKRVHLGLRPFECPTCCVKFKTKSHLEKHIRTHTGEKPFPCPHCAYTCAEKSNLKKHINVHLKGM